MPYSKQEQYNLILVKMRQLQIKRREEKTDRYDKALIELSKRLDDLDYQIRNEKTQRTSEEITRAQNRTQSDSQSKKSGGGISVVKTILVLVVLIFSWSIFIGPVLPEAFGLSGDLPGSYRTPLSANLERQAAEKVAPTLQNVANAPVSGVPLKLLGSQLGCWFGKSFVPSEVIQQQAYSPTKAWDICKKLTVKERADEIGCTNCYSITNFKTETVGVQATIIALTLDTPEGKQYCRNIAGTQRCEDISPVKNPKISVLYDSSKASLSGVNLDGDSIKIGGKNELSASVFPLDLRARIESSCTTKGFTPKAIFSYDYTSVGSATLSLRKESATKVSSLQNPVTFPGPVKLDLIPKPKDFAFDRDAEISVTIVLRNSGTGDAKINSVVLKQVPPLQVNGRLSFNGCVGPYTGKATEDKDGNILIPNFVSTLGKKQESNSIVCLFTAKSLQSQITDVATFGFEATADYNYQINQKGEPVSVNEVLTCEIPTTNWRSLQSTEVPQTLNNKKWTDVGYDDSVWDTVNLPNSGKCIVGCSRFYRISIIPISLSEGKIQDMFLSVASDDGSSCFLSNSDGTITLWDHLDEKHLPGQRVIKETDDARCKSGSGFDYCVKLNKDNGLKGGEPNIIACQVKNKVGENISFAISTEEQAVSSITSGSSDQIKAKAEATSQTQPSQASTQACTGNINLDVSVAKPYTATVSGLSNCDNIAAGVACGTNDANLCSCLVKGTGCSCEISEFDAIPTVPDPTARCVAVIDKNNDKDTDDDGESVEKVYTLPRPV